MTHRLPWLDFLRGLAALLVVLEHLRAFLFPPYASLPASGYFLKGFYLMTGFGHQAVMAFFVLSGFLVGGSVFRSLEAGTWSWGGYLLRRLSRLWTVLLPALLLTLIWDGWGRALDPSGYSGLFREIYHSGPVSGAAPASTPFVFAGNLFFLQTILVPCFGTDSPLWSLSNEFWYYLLFPLLVRVFFPGSLAFRVVSLVLGIVLLWCLPSEFLQGFVIWTMGAVTFRLISTGKAPAWLRTPPVLWLSLIIAVAVLISTRFSVSQWGDLALGCALLPLTGTLSLQSMGARWFHGISGAISEISYTLYLVHFPFLIWIFFSYSRGRQVKPDFQGLLLFLGLLVLVLLYSSGVWWCFERNTDRIRRWLGGRVCHSKGAC
jgi:peptidoglycan/LPS O-acetylase OafA/YrhL